MTGKTVEIHCYVDQLIDNTDGKFDMLSSAWFIVPLEWVEEQAKKAGWKDAKDFFLNYTYDTTDGWLAAAIEDGVLLGCGTGTEQATFSFWEDEENA